MNRIPRIDANAAGRDFVAGDLHGEFATLERLLDEVAFDAGRDRLFALGDLIDRGPDSAAALDWIENGRITLSVRVNHEQMLLEHITWAEQDPDAGTWGLTSRPWFANVAPEWGRFHRLFPSPGGRAASHAKFAPDAASSMLPANRGLIPSPGLETKPRWPLDTSPGSRRRST